MPIFNKRWLTVWLLPFSFLFRLAVYLRNLLYDHNLLPIVKLNVPVISVGNLTVGGTGKTPAVEYLARLLLANGRLPAIITRGYGRKTPGSVVVADGQRICASLEASGDEAMQLARRLKRAVVMADESKARGARLASETFNVDVVIVDDGFQHRKLQRDFDIVLIEAPSFFLNRWLLPAGPFREPLSALQRADAVILTNTDSAISSDVETVGALVRQQNREALLRRAVLRPSHFENLSSSERLPLSAVHGRRIFAACGIARPARFFDELRNLGAFVVGTAEFPDHYSFTSRNIADLFARAQTAQAETIIITEKDAQKWMSLFDAGVLPVLMLRVEFCAEGDASAFDREVLERFRKKLETTRPYSGDSREFQN
jgi:tetraacyldisaccharide 4'-kinase